MKKSKKVILIASLLVIILLILSLSFSLWFNKNIGEKSLKSEAELQNRIGNEYRVPKNAPFSEITDKHFYIKFPYENENSELDFYDSELVIKNVLTKVCDYQFSDENLTSILLSTDPGYIAKNKNYNRFDSNPASIGYEIAYNTKNYGVKIKLRKPSSLKSDNPYCTKAFYYKLQDEATYNGQNYSYYYYRDQDYVMKYIIFNIGNGVYELDVWGTEDNIEKFAEDTLNVMLG